jgi:hypothetical protein
VFLMPTFTSQQSAMCSRPQQGGRRVSAPMSDRPASTRTQISRLRPITGRDEHRRRCVHGQRERDAERVITRREEAPHCSLRCRCRTTARAIPARARRKRRRPVVAAPARAEMTHRGGSPRPPATLWVCVCERS